jgi:hypothetical protein
MPFDGVGFAFDERLGKLDQVIDMLAIPDKWCKGVLRTRDGRHCIRGAIDAVEGAILLPVVMRAIDEVTGKHHYRIEKFNDHRDTDHAKVLQVLARARANLVMGTAASKAPAPPGWRGRLRVSINGF